jgi:uncharacterized protein (DUF302 family)
MYYIVASTKTVNEAASDFEAAVKKHGFGVLHIYDLKQTLAGKGVTLPAECRIFEVCNPHEAAKVLGEDMRLNMALPCRVSVFEQDGVTQIGTNKATELLGLLSRSPELSQVATRVERTIETIINEAAA